MTGERQRGVWTCPQCAQTVVQLDRDDLMTLLDSVTVRSHVAGHLQAGTPPPSTTQAELVGGPDDGHVTEVSGLPQTLTIYEPPPVLLAEHKATGRPLRTLCEEAGLPGVAYLRGGRSEDGTVRYWHPSLVEAARRRLGHG